MGSKAVWVVEGFAGTIIVAAIHLAASRHSRDPWELTNSYRVLDAIAAAEKTAATDSMSAWTQYAAILGEARQHTVTDATLGHRLAEASTAFSKLDAEKRRRDLEREKAAEAEREKRRKELEAQAKAAEEHKAAELRRMEEAKRSREETARKLADERRAEEAKRLAVEAERMSVIEAYAHPPRSARALLESATRLEAKVETGVSYDDLSAITGEVWGDVKVFVGSEDARRVPAFAVIMESAILKYRLSLQVWGASRVGNRYRNRSYGDAVQECWSAARRRTEIARALFSGKVPVDLEAFCATVEQMDSTFDSAATGVLTASSTKDAVDSLREVASRDMR